jgi:hypothetical protein
VTPVQSPAVSPGRLRGPARLRVAVHLVGEAAAAAVLLTQHNQFPHASALGGRLERDGTGAASTGGRSSSGPVERGRTGRAGPPWLRQSG